MRKRGRPKKDAIREPAKNPQTSLMDKMEEAVMKSKGKPLIYVSSTKGTMKILYEGHHFKYTFRKGQFSMFQCCFKENNRECKVKVLSDQRYVYPYEGEHIHFMQAIDKSVTSEIIEPFVPKEEIDDIEIHENREASTVAPRNNAVHVIDQQVVTPPQFEVLHYDGAVHGEFDSSNNAADTNPKENVDEFKEKIKKRLQKALMGKKK